MNNSKKAVSLVELLVAISVLLILMIIAYLVFNNYSQSARDAKRASDVRSLSDKISIAYANNLPYEKTLIWTENHEVTIAWETHNAIQWTVNFSILGLNQENFVDPFTWENYIFAASVWTLTYAGKEQAFNFLEWTYHSEVDDLDIIIWNYEKYYSWDSDYLFTWALNVWETDSKTWTSITCDMETIPNDNWNIIFMTWKPIEENTPWQDEDYEKPCYYECKSGYWWKNCDIAGLVKWVEALEPTTIGCPYLEEDIIATLNWVKMRIAWCNAFGWTGNSAPDAASTITDENWVHYFYTYPNWTNWCTSKWWRIPTRDEYLAMIKTFWLKRLNNPWYAPYYSNTTEAPFNFYPPWWTSWRYWTSTNHYYQGDNSNDYYYLFSIWQGSLNVDNPLAYRINNGLNEHISRVYNYLPVRCIKEY